MKFTIASHFTETYVKSSEIGKIQKYKYKLLRVTTAAQKDIKNLNLRNIYTCQQSNQIAKYSKTYLNKLVMHSNACNSQNIALPRLPTFQIKYTAAYKYH